MQYWGMTLNSLEETVDLGSRERLFHNIAPMNQAHDRSFPKLPFVSVSKQIFEQKHFIRKWACRRTKFHIHKCFARRLVLPQKHKVTWKRPFERGDYKHAAESMSCNDNCRGYQSWTNEFQPLKVSKETKLKACESVRSYFCFLLSHRL